MPHLISKCVWLQPGTIHVGFNKLLYNDEKMFANYFLGIDRPAGGKQTSSEKVAKTAINAIRPAKKQRKSADEVSTASTTTREEIPAMQGGRKLLFASLINICSTMILFQLVLLLLGVNRSKLEKAIRELPDEEELLMEDEDEPLMKVSPEELKEELTWLIKLVAALERPIGLGGRDCDHLTGEHLAGIQEMIGFPFYIKMWLIHAAHKANKAKTTAWLGTTKKSPPPCPAASLGTMKGLQQQQEAILQDSSVSDDASEDEEKAAAAPKVEKTVLDDGSDSSPCTEKKQRGEFSATSDVAKYNISQLLRNQILLHPVKDELIPALAIVDGLIDEKIRCVKDESVAACKQAFKEGTKEFLAEVMPSLVVKPEAVADHLMPKVEEKLQKLKKDLEAKANKNAKKVDESYKILIHHVGELKNDLASTDAAAKESSREEAESTETMAPPDQVAGTNEDAKTESPSGEVEEKPWQEEDDSLVF